jgi:hypothetical protein
MTMFLRRITNGLVVALILGTGALAQTDDLVARRLEIQAAQEAEEPLKCAMTGLAQGIADAITATDIAAGGIGATGEIGENALKRLGGSSQVYFPTSDGGRYVDQFVDGIAHEAKVGYVSLRSPGIQRQIMKDVELIKLKRIRASKWHFFRSPVTGCIGPSGPLRQALIEKGIEIIIESSI